MITILTVLKSLLVSHQMMLQWLPWILPNFHGARRLWGGDHISLSLDTSFTLFYWDFSASWTTLVLHNLQLMLHAPLFLSLFLALSVVPIRSIHRAQFFISCFESCESSPKRALFCSLTFSDSITASSFSPDDVALLFFSCSSVPLSLPRGIEGNSRFVITIRGENISSKRMKKDERENQQKRRRKRKEELEEDGILSSLADSEKIKRRWVIIVIIVLLFPLPLFNLRMMSWWAKLMISCFVWSYKSFISCLFFFWWLGSSRQPLVWSKVGEGYDFPRFSTAAWVGFDSGIIF